MRTRFLLLALFVFTASLAGAQTIAVRAGNLIDPANGTVAKDQTILVKSGKLSRSARTSKSLGMPKSWTSRSLG